MGSKDIDDHINVLGGTAFQSDLVVFPTPCQVAVPASSLLSHDCMFCPPGPKFDDAVCVKFINPIMGCRLRKFFLLRVALNSKLSGGPPESRRAAENGSNRDSSEAVRSGSGGPQRPGEWPIRMAPFFMLGSFIFG